MNRLLRNLCCALACAGALYTLAGCPEVPRPKPRASTEVTASGATTTQPTATTAAPSTASAHEDPPRVQLVEQAMGTRITLAAYPQGELGEAAIRAALGRALAEIRRLEALMSPVRPDSDLARINAAAGRQAVTVHPDTAQVIAKSLWISERSGGVFDVTFASMGRLWWFDRDRPFAPPSQQQVEEARRRVDYRKIQLDSQARSVRLASSKTRIDLGGIAKGFAVDRAAAELRRAGLQAFFVQAGGDLYVAGRKPTGKPWRVGIRDPRGAESAFFAYLPVEDHALSTSGDYERGVVHQGKRYHHIIDPRTGYPATRSRSVSILAPDALTADAIDNAVFILGPEQGLRLVESLDDCGAVIVDADNRVHLSKRVQKLVQMVRPPTDGV